MVAPTRAPQARGVKCDLCKKILLLTTWLDQTKLAKSVEEASNVINLINEHDKSGCSCIPNNIQNLIVGSTYFEIHRLIYTSLDSQTHQKQVALANQVRLKIVNDTKLKGQPINDCNELQKSSRFKIYANNNDQELVKKGKEHIAYLRQAIKYWKIAFEDQTSPFNSKLALRLGLSHHVIYACYLFKFYRILDDQLIATNLLVNLFSSIEGITSHAVLHAYFLFIKSLLDLDQTQLACQYLKQAMKIACYKDKTHYESILLTCLACEISLLDQENIHEGIEELARLAVIQPNDKLQHYYARSLAISIVIKYIQYYPARSDCCFEFYHCYRYLSAIIRRCYDSSFVLVLSEKGSNITPVHNGSTPLEQVSSHSWVKFAACDFVFTTFELLSRFFIRTGQPETLELVYNALNLIAYRTGCSFWQYKMLEIGSHLDLLCDRLAESSKKLDAASHLTANIDNSYLMNLMRISSEVCLLNILNRQGSLQQVNVVLELLDRIKMNLNSSIDKLHPIELFDCKTLTYQKTVKNSESSDSMILLASNDHSYLGLKVIKIAVSLMIRLRLTKKAQSLMYALGNQLKSFQTRAISFDHEHLLLETLLIYCNGERSEYSLVEAIASSSLFLRMDQSLESQLSELTLRSKPSKRKTGLSRAKRASKTTVARTRRKGLYDVESNSRENIPETCSCDDRDLTIADVLINLESAKDEVIILMYLRRSEPNPDYLLYRRAHELLFALRLLEIDTTPEQLLYHFVESNTSNTIRYRWMLFEEPQADPYDLSNDHEAFSSSNQLRWLSFNSSVSDINLAIKSMRRSLSDKTRIVQIKHILSDNQREENLLIVSFDGKNEPIFVHLKRPLDESIDALHELCDRFSSSATLPDRISSIIDRSKGTLFSTNQRSRAETRQKLEAELGVLLYDFENEFIGPFRFLLCPKILDPDYQLLITGIRNDITHTLRQYTCRVEQALELMLTNAPILNRDEFCHVLSNLFNCKGESELVKECFDIWMKAMEKFICNRGVNISKLAYLQNLSKGHIGLILDKRLEQIPFESLPVARILKNSIFRLPSLRIHQTLIAGNHNRARVELKSTFYLLDPADNLKRTRERFEGKLKAQLGWSGWIAKGPDTKQLEDLFLSKQFYLFIGHGAGTVYYNQLRGGRGLNAMQRIISTALVMGCSSGRLQSEGPLLESFGISWVFVMRGSPAYVGLLWDVTDTDIDKFLDSLLSDLLGDRWTSAESASSLKAESICLAQAIARARQACQLKLLVGSTPVLYGLPVQCKC